MDIEDFLHNLIISEPKEKNTYNLEFIEEIGLKELFELLLDLFTKICKLNYSNDKNIVDLKRLKKNEINYINKYFESFGFNININIYDYNIIDFDTQTYLLNNKYDNYSINKKTKLSELFFILKSDNYIYKISFDLI